MATGYPTKFFVKGDVIMSKNFCKVCGDDSSLTQKRFAKGYTTCIEHGDLLAKQRKFTVAIPYGKGAYQLIHDPSDLFNTNQKNTRG